MSNDKGDQKKPEGNEPEIKPGSPETPKTIGEVNDHDTEARQLDEAIRDATETRLPPAVEQPVTEGASERTAIEARQRELGGLADSVSEAYGIVEGGDTGKIEPAIQRAIQGDGEKEQTQNAVKEIVHKEEYRTWSRPNRDKDGNIYLHRPFKSGSVRVYFPDHSNHNNVETEFIPADLKVSEIEERQLTDAAFDAALRWREMGMWPQGETEPAVISASTEAPVAQPAKIVSEQPVPVVVEEGGAVIVGNAQSQPAPEGAPNNAKEIPVATDWQINNNTVWWRVGDKQYQATIVPLVDGGFTVDVKTLWEISTDPPQELRGVARNAAIALVLESARVQRVFGEKFGDNKQYSGGVKTEGATPAVEAAVEGEQQIAFETSVGRWTRIGNNEMGLQMGRRLIHAYPIDPEHPDSDPKEFYYEVRKRGGKWQRVNLKGEEMERALKAVREELSLRRSGTEKRWPFTEAQEGTAKPITPPPPDIFDRDKFSQGWAEAGKGIELVEAIKNWVPNWQAVTGTRADAVLRADGPSGINCEIRARINVGEASVIEVVVGGPGVDSNDALREEIKRKAIDNLIQGLGNHSFDSAFPVNFVTPFGEVAKGVDEVARALGQAYPGEKKHFAPIEFHGLAADVVSKHQENIYQRAGIEAAIGTTRAPGLGGYLDIPRWLWTRYNVLNRKGGLGEDVKKMFEEFQAVRDAEVQKGIGENQLLSKEETDAALKKMLEHRNRILERFSDIAPEKRAELADAIDSLLWEFSLRPTADTNERDREINRVIKEHADLKINGMQAIAAGVDSALVGLGLFTHGAGFLVRGGARAGFRVALRGQRVAREERGKRGRELAVKREQRKEEIWAEIVEKQTRDEDVSALEKEFVDLHFAGRGRAKILEGDNWWDKLHQATTNEGRERLQQLIGRRLVYDGVVGTGRGLVGLMEKEEQERQFRDEWAKATEANKDNSAWQRLKVSAKFRGRKTLNVLGSLGVVAQSGGLIMASIGRKIEHAAQGLQTAVNSVDKASSPQAARGILEAAYRRVADALIERTAAQEQLMTEASQRGELLSPSFRNHIVAFDRTYGRVWHGLHMAKDWLGGIETSQVGSGNGMVPAEQVSSLENPDFDYIDRLRAEGASDEEINRISDYIMKHRYSVQHEGGSGSAWPAAQPPSTPEGFRAGGISQDAEQPSSALAQESLKGGSGVDLSKGHGVEWHEGTGRIDLDSRLPHRPDNWHVEIERRGDGLLDSDRVYFYKDGQFKEMFMPPAGVSSENDFVAWADSKITELAGSSGEALQSQPLSEMFWTAKVGERDSILGLLKHAYEGNAKNLGYGGDLNNAADLRAWAETTSTRQFVADYLWDYGRPGATHHDVEAAAMWQKLASNSEVRSPSELLDSMKRLSVNDFNHVLQDKVANLVFENDDISLDDKGNIHVAAPDGTERLGHVPDYGGKAAGDLLWQETVDAEGKTVDTTEVGRGLLKELPRGARAVAYDYDGDGRADSIIVTDYQGHQSRFDSDKYPQVGSETTPHFLQRVNAEIYDLKEAGVLTEAPAPRAEVEPAKTGAASIKESLVSLDTDEVAPSGKMGKTVLEIETKYPASPRASVSPAMGADSSRGATAPGAADLVGAVRAGRSEVEQQELIHRMFGSEAVKPEGASTATLVDALGHKIDSDNFFGVAEDQRHVLWYDGSTVRNLDVPEGVNIKADAASAVVEGVAGSSMPVHLDYGTREINGAVFIDPKLGPMFVERGVPATEPVPFVEAVNRFASGSKNISETAPQVSNLIPDEEPRKSDFRPITKRGAIAPEGIIAEFAIQPVDKTLLPHLPDGWQAEISVGLNGIPSRIDFVWPDGQRYDFVLNTQGRSKEDFLRIADKVLEGKEGPVT